MHEGRNSNRRLSDRPRRRERGNLFVPITHGGDPGASEQNHIAREAKKNRDKTNWANFLRLRDEEAIPFSIRVSATVFRFRIRPTTGASKIQGTSFLPLSPLE